MRAKLSSQSSNPPLSTTIRFVGSGRRRPPEASKTERRLDLTCILLSPHDVMEATREAPRPWQ
jgi:hypothetical protein